MAETEKKPSDKIVLLEGKQTDHPSFFLSLRQKGYDVEIAANGSALIGKVHEFSPSIILIDAASLRTACNRIIYRLKQAKPDIRIILILDKGLTEKRISSKADIVMVLPFTVQKLVSQIKLLYSLDTPECRKYGKLAYNAGYRSVEIFGRITRLTPIVADILNLFLKQPDTILHRKEIFSTVWETDYVEDTRTLDVHIQWLRKALEKNPNNPKIIRTKKNKGYWLDTKNLYEEKPPISTEAPES